MVSLLKPETQKIIEVEVKHLMTEKEAIAIAETNRPIIAVQEASQPPAVASSDNAAKLAEAKAELAEAKKDAEQWEKAFGWAMCFIFTLLFAFVTVYGLTTPHDPDKITWLNIVQLVFGSAMVGTFATNIMHSFGIFL